MLLEQRGTVAWDGSEGGVGSRGFGMLLGSTLICWPACGGEQLNNRTAGRNAMKDVRDCR